MLSFMLLPGMKYSKIAPLALLKMVFLEPPCPFVLPWVVSDPSTVHQVRQFCPPLYAQ